MTVAKRSAPRAGGENHPVQGRAPGNGRIGAPAPAAAKPRADRPIGAGTPNGASADEFEARHLERVARMQRSLISAIRRGDRDHADYCFDAWKEMKWRTTDVRSDDVEDIIERLAKTARGKRYMEERQDLFLKRYADLKAKAGFSTLREVAKAAGLSMPTVQAVERGRGRPHFKTMAKLARAFGVMVSELR